MNRAVWQKLLSLESRDVTQQRFEQIHSKKLNARRAREINAAARQAREYFRNGSNSDHSVRPLLTFYGVTSLSRALLLLLKADGGEEGLNQGHGIEAVKWREVMSGGNVDGLPRLNDLRVRLRSGLFSDFVKYTRNRMAMHIRSGGVDWRVFYDLPDQSEQISVEDLFSRIPDLWEDYSDVSRLRRHVGVNDLSYREDSGLKVKVKKEGACLGYARALFSYALDSTYARGKRGCYVANDSASTTGGRGIVSGASRGNDQRRVHYRALVARSPLLNRYLAGCLPESLTRFTEAVERTAEGTACRVRSTSPARSSTRRCVEIAGREMLDGAANSPTVAPSEKRENLAGGVPVLEVERVGHRGHHVRVPRQHLDALAWLAGGVPLPEEVVGRRPRRSGPAGEELNVPLPPSSSMRATASKRPLDGDQAGDDLDGLGRPLVGIRPLGDLIEVVPNAGDLPVAFSLDVGRRGRPRPRARHRTADPARRAARPRLPPWSAGRRTRRA